VPGKAGRPPVVGKRQPTLKQRLVSPKARWRSLLVTGWSSLPSPPHSATDFGGRTLDYLQPDCAC
jgi:hypothetical protein